MPDVFTSGWLRVTEQGERRFLHGTRLQRLSNGNAVTSAPYLAELTPDGRLIREWGFDYDGPPDPGPFHFPPRAWVWPGTIFADDAGIVMVGVFGASAWDDQGREVWRNSTWELPRGAAFEPGAAIWMIAGQELVRLSRATGEPELIRPLPPGLTAGVVTLRPGGDLILSGYFGRTEILDFDGELRGAVGSGGIFDANDQRTFDSAVAFLDREGGLKGLWALGEWGEQTGVVATATPAGLVVQGPYGTRPAADWDVGLMTLPRPQSLGGPFALASPWNKVDQLVRPRCAPTTGVPLVRTGIDVQLVLDVSIEATREVPGTGLPLRQLAANGFADTFQQIRTSDDRLSYLLFPWVELALNHGKAPWPTVDRKNALTNAFFTEVALAPLGVGPTIGMAIRRAVRGARALTVGHDRGEVRHGVLLIVAASASAPSWTAADLTTLASAPGGTPRLATHIIGLGEPSAAIDALATAAGRPAVYVPIDASVPAGVGAAVDAIRREYQCSYRSSDTRIRIDDGLLLHAQDPATRARVDIPLVDACAPDGEGWTLDHRAWRDTALLCPATCDALLDGRLRFLELDRPTTCQR